MLKGLIYYDYVVQQNIENTITGSRVSDNENSEEGDNSRTSEIRFSKSIESYEAIQYKICKNISSYPEFAGVELHTRFQGLV